MTSLKTVKSRAQAATCLSNLKQLGISLQLYASDNNGVYPPSFDGSLIWPQILINQNYMSSMPNTGDPAYIKLGNHIDYCPAQPANKVASGFYGNYGANDCVMWIAPDRYSNIRGRQNNIKYPSKTILLGDSTGYRLSAVERSSLSDPAYVHNGGLHLLYCDGHVGWVKEPLPTVATELPWSTMENW